MKEKVITIILVGLVMLSLIGMVNAEEIKTTIGEGLIDRIISYFRFASHQTDMFTVYGREMECSIYPDTKVYLKKGDDYYFNQENICGAQSFFINYYRGQPGNDQYIKEIYYKDEKAYVTDGDGQGSLYISPYVKCDAGAYWDNNCYIEVYCCSQGACENDYECLGNQYCNKDAHISQLFPQLGVCEYEEIQTHTTKVYQCLEDGTSSFLREVSSDSINWCSNPDKNNYLIPAGGTSGVCYTEENQPCYVVGEADCSDYNTEYKCEQDSKCEWEEGSFLVHGKCVEKVEGENGEEEEATASYDYSELDTLTSSQLSKALCTDSGGCPGDSRCVIISSLISNGYITEEQMKVTRKDFCKDLSLWERFLDSDYRDTCTKSILPGPMDTIFKTRYGFCISGEEEGFSKFLKSLAFFDITGDKTTDGAIILGVGALILFIFFSRLGGLHGKIEYEK